MQNSKFKIQNFQLPAIVLFLAFALLPASAQSTNQLYPTPVTANEIGGKISARDLGDARLTNYFYAFGGNQGDVFINVKTTNFDGDIDIFTADNLRPLTKITIFSGDSETETGRVIYLRKSEKLILRIQGRSPNDAPAAFSIKFAGSFAPAAAVAESDAPEQPEVKTENQSNVRVNSVGTITEVKPKPTPKPKEVVAKNETKKSKTPPRVEENTETEREKVKETEAEKVAENKPENEAKKPAETAPKSPDVVTENTVESETAVTAEKTAEPIVSAVKNKKRVKIEKTAKPSAKKAVAKKIETKEPNLKEPNLLENVRLIILFKDGTKIERAMSEVLRVGVDKDGILTLITKDGTIGRYQILDVAKMTIE